jgi:hypothetical protein
MLRLRFIRKLVKLSIGQRIRHYIEWNIHLR